MQVELIQFRHSPYNEKVRWALDYKRVPHRRSSVLPGPHMGRVRKLTGRTSTPVLVVDGVALDGSAAIIDRLEALFPTPPLMPADAASRREALELQRRFDDDWVPRVRRAVLQSLLATPRFFAAVFGHGRPAAARFAYSLVVPLAAPLVRRGNGITGDASVADGIAAAGEALDQVARRAAATGYLAGDRFTLADLAACASLAPILRLPGTPMEKNEPMGAPYAALLDRFHEHPGAVWARGIYARHRGATADFEGASSYH